MNARSLMFEERSFFDWEMDINTNHCQHKYRKSINRLGCPQYKCVKCQETKESDPDEDRDWWQMEAVQAGLRADEYYKRALAATDKSERDKYFECCSKDRTVQATIQSLITNSIDKTSLDEQKEVEINDEMDIEPHSNPSPPVDDTLLGELIHSEINDTLLGELPHSEIDDILLGELPHFKIGDRVFWKTESKGYVPCVIEKIWVNKAKVCTAIFERINVAIADLVPFNEKLKPATVKENSWNPKDFGETPMKAEEDGQLTIFFDDSIEPPLPDDYPDTSSYESAWQEWQNNHKSEDVLPGVDIKEKNPKGISFGKTLTQLYNGKTCTRRQWSDRQIKTFINYFEQGIKVPAYDKGLQYGGEIIGWLTLTQKPYQDELINMTQADLKAEGFPDYTLDQFIDEFFEEKNQTVWVIWFDFQPNKNKSENKSRDNSEFLNEFLSEIEGFTLKPEVDIKSQVDQIEVLLKAQFEYDMVKTLIAEEKEAITELILAKFGDKANPEAIIDELINRLPTGKPLISSLSDLDNKIEPLGFLTEISPTFDKKQRTFGHGSGYLFKKTCKGKYPQWWFQVEEKGKKRTYYVPKNKYSHIHELNEKLAPVKDILKALSK